MRVALLLAAGLLAPALTACSQAADSSDGPKVVASFYPLQYVAERVAGDGAEVSALTSPGQEPHDLELTVQQSAEVADADLVLTLTGLQPSVDDAVEQDGPGVLVDAADLQDGDDPHLWLDPTRMATLAEQTAEALGEEDPGGAQDYRRNARDLARELRTLDRDYRTGLSKCRVRTVVVSHDAFGYLERYGLEVVGVAGVSPDAEPSPARLEELTRLIRRTEVTTVFTETLASPAIARTLAEEVGVRTATLDPIEGLADETADEDYLSLMRRNLEALREAGGCA